MKGIVYTENGTAKVLDCPKPTIQEPTAAVVRMLHASICGTDLHILKGDVPTAKPGLIMGHEVVGIIEELGSTVQELQLADRVIISCMTSCGSCTFCERGIPAHCKRGGWVLGHSIDGTLAEYVRGPHATLSQHRLDPSIHPRTTVRLSDALPRGYECGVLNAGVRPQGSVVIVGAGTVGWQLCLLPAEATLP